MQQEDIKYIFKIVIIGDSGVGKTNLLSRFTKGEFTADTKPTIGLEFSSKVVEIGGEKVKAQIWDTAGQERYRNIANAYYRGSIGNRYDITDRTTFKNVEGWLADLKKHTTESIVLCLVGNKTDLDQHRLVSTEEALLYAKENNLAFIETSAFDCANVDEMFQQVFELAMKEIKQHQQIANQGKTQLDASEILAKNESK